MSFARPELLWLAAGLPALVLVAVLGYGARRRRVARLLGDGELVRRLGGPGDERLPAFRAAVLCGAAAAIGLAAAGPHWGVREVEGRPAGRDVVLVVDVSRSMLVRDLIPDRLERQRLLARQLVRELEGSRVGLVAFAGRAHILSPLTTDRGVLELYLDALDAEIASQGGSSLATAIRQGTDLARQGYERRGGQRTVILMSDGESHEEAGDVLEAAARAARAGVTIHTVTIGTGGGGPVPAALAGGEVTEYLRHDGAIVISRADAALMRRIAAATGGRAVTAEQPGAAAELAAAVRRGGSGEEAAADGDGVLQPHDRFRWFVALALALLALDALALHGRSRGRRVARLEGRP